MALEEAKGLLNSGAPALPVDLSRRMSTLLFTSCKSRWISRVTISQRIRRSKRSWMKGDILSWVSSPPEWSAADANCVMESMEDAGEDDINGMGPGCGTLNDEERELVLGAIGGVPSLWSLVWVRMPDEKEPVLCSPFPNGPIRLVTVGPGVSGPSSGSESKLPDKLDSLPLW